MSCSDNTHVAMQAFIPDAKDALEEVDVLKKDTLTDMEKQLGRKEGASPGCALQHLLSVDIMVL